MKNKSMLLFVCILALRLHGQTATCNCGTGGGFSFSASPGEITSFNTSGGRWVADMRYYFLAFTSPQRTGKTMDTNTTAIRPDAMQQLVPGFGYRLTDKISFAAALPFYSIRSGSSNALYAGDLQLAAQYTMRPKLAWPALLRFIAGVKLPTGSTAVIASRSMVAGTGSTDVTGGVQFQLQRRKLVYRYSGQFRYAGTGYENIRFGNSSIQQAGVYWQPIAETCASDSSSQKMTYGFTGDATWEWQQMQSQGVSYFENSGQQNFWLGLGVVLKYRAFSLPLGAEVPAYHVHNGSQAVPHFRVRAGLSVKIN